ncbi:MAG: N-acetylmuramic acid 6-phosphate etherase [Verrucomicrobiae bacterium]|nr:N-acetylmuramic acid 6-phosphate etherase [Verrucomicrobiae bacterium]
MEAGHWWIGVECGGTRTVALAVDDAGGRDVRATSGPANLRLLDDARLEAHFRSLSEKLPPPSGIGVGMAGVRDRADCQRVEAVLDRVWPGVPRRVDHDLESALAAAEPPAGRSEPFDARVILLSGTGSCCFGRNRRGVTAKVGGWGHHLGDRGSAYDIAYRALREAAHSLDHSGIWSPFGRRALRALMLNEPNELIAWMQTADKTSVAALAPEVFLAAGEGDPGARRLLIEVEAILAGDALACAHHLSPAGRPVQFVLAGSVLLNQKDFARRIGVRIRKARPGSVVQPLPRESVWGAVVMARQAGASIPPAPPAPRTQPRSGSGSPKAPVDWIPGTRAQSPTERRNPRSGALDRMSLGEAVALMLAEERRGVAALSTHRATLERLVRKVVRTFRCGGRLFYVGAGTSGRLGVLDASECPPTFRTLPDQVQGIIAGGERALYCAVEGAEDDGPAGALAVVSRGVTRSDCVIGIAASGRTPFVWGALARARLLGAGTALVCCNPHLDFRGGWKPDLVVAVDTGPEVLTGSTRLKAGTVTKLILNLVTTLAMVRMGKVMGNLMVDLHPSNAKLRDRACRMVQELTGVGPEAAREALEHHGWSVKAAVSKK